MKKLSYRSKVIASSIAVLGVCIGIAYAAQSYRLNVGASITITEHTVTGNYSNTCTSDIFIPTNTAAEWTAFRNNKPACILSPCFAADSSSPVSAGTNFTGYNASSRDAEATGLTCTTATYACSTAGAWSPSTPYAYCDDYGTSIYSAVGSDTCNGDASAQYTCGANETKVCSDKWYVESTPECIDWDFYTGECIEWTPGIEYYKRTITCRGSDPAASCTAQAKTVNGHSYSTPLIAHGVTTPVNSTTTTAATITCAGNTYNYRQSFVCSYGVLSTSGTETTNTATCGAGYTASGTGCVANTQTVACGGSIPTNATAKAGHGTYTQTYACGGTWSPTRTWAQNATICGWTCNSGYGWNGTACVSGAVAGSCDLPNWDCLAGSYREYGCSSTTNFRWYCDGVNGGTTATCNKSTSACNDGGGDNCLVAGTKILMADGTEKNIEDIKVGEKIVTYNEILKQNMTDTVLEAIHNKSAERIIYTIDLENGKTLRPNNVHSMYEVNQNGYQTIDKLYERFKKGEVLLFRDMDGKNVRVIGMRSEKVNIPVYNLHVAGIKMLNPDPNNPFIGVGHSYYANGVLSHNAIFWIDQSDVIDAMSLQIIT